MDDGLPRRIEPIAGDPRSIVTPDAFSVTPDLLGTPLAEPWRRFAALMVDLVLIGFLQLLGWRILGGIVGLTLFRMATRRPDGTAGGPVRKIALGCAGTFVLMLAIGITFLPSILRNASERADIPIAVQFGDSVMGGAERASPANVAELVEELVDVADDVRDRDQRIADLEEQLAEAEAPSTLFTWIRDAADEAGLVFGWGTIYLTLFLALWGGRTPGKKLFGTRVVRLNGQPLGLYMSLERAGGYAAGLATGLLGFAQVWWDPNRQAIHDKIAETVVVREGMAKRSIGQRSRAAGVAVAAATRQDSGGGRGGRDGGAAGKDRQGNRSRIE